MRIIAEIGINHGGSLSKARWLIKMAKESGAHAVKFQLYDPISIFRTGTVQYDEAEKCRLTEQDYAELHAYASDLSMTCFASVFDAQRLGWLEKLGVKYHKLATRVVLGDKKLCRQILELGKETFVSLTPAAVCDKSVRALLSGYSNVTPILCVPEYPAIALSYGRLDFKWLRGLSDHTIGIRFAIYASSKGAEVIEKHFTYDKCAAGSDHSCSMIAEELYMLVAMSAALEKYRVQGL